MAAPRLVDFQTNGSGNYRLHSGSPASNEAVVNAAPAYDLERIARPRRRCR
jgi:hypothetical protein